MRTALRRLVLAPAVLAAALSVAAVPASAAPATPAGRGNGPGVCPPSAFALGFSDALDKAVYDGATVGGLSDLAFDKRSLSWASTVDNNGSDPARIWFYRDLAHPRIVRDPLVLRRPDGTPYTGMDSDNEGLAVLPDGEFAVSSETEPSVRIFDRSGMQRASLPVPGRFAVTGSTPAGEATSNATLEGLTITPDGRTIIAAMEGALSGDVSASGDATSHRLLVYRATRNGQWKLVKQVGYRADAGMRIPEVTAYSNDSVLVEEASFSTTTGNAVDVYAVPGLTRAADVSDVANLSSVPARKIAGKTLVANLVGCPTLGAPSKETQANPLLDNFEGMSLTTPDIAGFAGLALISDDNFSATQTTRIVRLAVHLPRS